jgi:hypothetical protein
MGFLGRKLLGDYLNGDSGQQSSNFGFPQGQSFGGNMLKQNLFNQFQQQPQQQFGLQNRIPTQNQFQPQQRQFQQYNMQPNQSFGLMNYWNRGF